LTVILHVEFKKSNVQLLLFENIKQSKAEKNAVAKAFDTN